MGRKQLGIRHRIPSPDRHIRARVSLPSKKRAGAHQSGDARRICRRSPVYRRIGIHAYQAMLALGKTGFEASFSVTAVFILIPSVLGCLVLRYYVRPRKKPVRYRWLKLLILGILGLVVWAGYVIGPILVICAGLKALFDAKSREKEIRSDPYPTVWTGSPFSENSGFRDPPPPRIRKAWYNAYNVPGLIQVNKNLIDVLKKCSEVIQWTCV